MLQILTKVSSALSIAIGCPFVLTGLPFGHQVKSFGIYRPTLSFHQRQRMLSAPL